MMSNIFSVSYLRPYKLIPRKKVPFGFFCYLRIFPKLRHRQIKIEKKGSVAITADMANGENAVL